MRCLAVPPRADLLSDQPLLSDRCDFRLLNADDQKVNLNVLKTMLKKLGPFDIVMAKDGQEALELLTASDAPFDLVLTDMWMPVMDGEMLVRAIRAEEKFAALPVYVVTADTELPAKYRELGFDGILLKPVTVEKLRELFGRSCRP